VAAGGGAAVTDRVRKPLAPWLLFSLGSGFFAGLTAILAIALGRSCWASQ